MKTLSVWCETCDEPIVATWKIKQHIPCWMNKTISDKHTLVEVTCREEDMSYVEYTLAPYV